MGFDFIDRDADFTSIKDARFWPVYRCDVRAVTAIYPFLTQVNAITGGVNSKAQLLHLHLDERPFLLVLVTDQPQYASQ